MRSFFFAAAALLAAGGPALAVECPEGAKSCKVVVLTDDQISTLELMIDNTAISAPHNTMAATIKFYHDLFEKAPAGEVKKVEGNK